MSLTNNLKEQDEIATPTSSSLSSANEGQAPQLLTADHEEELDQQLRREFTIEDARALTQDKTDPESQNQQSSLLERVYTQKSDTGEPQLNLPPDGGYGWVCTFCAGVIYFATWGSNSAFGVYLAFYINNETFPGSTSMDFAWIAGLIVFTAQLFSPVALTLDKLIGLKPTMSIAVVLHTAGYLLASFATKLWHLYVCQGLLVGSAFSFIFVPASTIVPNWFLKKRALASGVMCTGTGLGGVFYSLTINAMIQQTGNQRWSLRFVAITTAFLMIIAITFIKRFNPPPRPHITAKLVMSSFRSMFNPNVLRKSRLWFTVGWFCFTMLAYNITLFSYATAARAMGLSQHQGSTLTALMNAAQAIGRPTMGFVADAWVGRVTYTMVLNCTVMILIFAFWIQARSFGALIACGMCLGLTLGVGNVMNPVLTADSFEPDEFACAWAMLNVCQGFFVLFSEVIALSLKDDSLTNSYTHAEVFAGFMFFAGFLCLLPLREFHVRKLLEKTKGEGNEKTHDIDDTLHPLENVSYFRRMTYPIKV